MVVSQDLALTWESCCEYNFEIGNNLACKHSQYEKCNSGGIGKGLWDALGFAADFTVLLLARFSINCKVVLALVCLPSSVCMQGWKTGAVMKILAAAFATCTEVPLCTKVRACKLFLSLPKWSNQLRIINDVIEIGKSSWLYDNTTQSNQRRANGSCSHSECGNSFAQAPNMAV